MKYLFIGMLILTSVFSARSQSTSNTQDKNVELYITFKNSEALKATGLLKDTIIFKYYSKPISDNELKLEADQSIYAVEKNGVYVIKTSIPDPIGYFTLAQEDSENTRIQHYHLIEPGDRLYIQIEIKEDALGHPEFKRAYFGRGAYKLMFKERMVPILERYKTENLVLFDSLEKLDTNYCEIKKIGLINFYLSQMKAGISNNAYKALKTDLIAERLVFIYETAGVAGKNSTYDSVAVGQLLNYLDLQRYIDDPISHIRSPYTAQLQKLRAQAVAKLKFGKLTTTGVLKCLETQYSGEEFDKIYAFTVLSYGSSIPKADSIIRSKQNKISPAYFKLLKPIITSASGAMAFDFKLPDMNGKMVKLTDFKGKVVFLDFWFTGCGACKIFYNEAVKPAKDIFKNNKDVIFMTISVDVSSEKWKQSIKQDIYTSSDAVNLFTEGKGSLHPAVKEFAIDGYPTPVLISKSGQIVREPKNFDFRRKDRLVAEINKLLSKN